MTLFGGEGNRGGSGDGDRALRRRFPGEVGGGTREREGVVGSTAITGRCELSGLVGLGLVCMEVFRFEVNGWRGRLGVTISTASMIILGLTGVVCLGGSGCGAGSSSSSSGSSSSATAGTSFVVRDRAGSVVDFEGPTLALAVRVLVRVDALEGSLVEGGGLVEGGFLDGGFNRKTCSSTSAGRTPGGLPRRVGGSIMSTSGTTSTSIATAGVFLVARFGGTFSVLDGPATVFDRVALASGFFFVGSSGSRTLGSGSTFAVRRVARVVARGLGGGLAGVTGPSDRSLRREGSDGRGSAGAFRFGGILFQAAVLRDFGG